MKKKACKITLWVVAGLAALILIMMFGVGNYMLKYALQPEMKTYEEFSALDGADKWTPGIGEWGKQMLALNLMKDTVMTVNGADMQTYYAFPGDGTVPSGKTAVIVHGYTSNPMSMMMIARMYRDHFGYNVVLPTLKYHGRSGGDAIQMGWLDRLDVLEWSAWAHERFGDTLQVVHGISMGGATTMMVSGEDTPEYIRAFVDDCGYTSAWDQFAFRAKVEFHMPPFPVMTGANILCRKRFGWDFKEASCLEQVAKCEKPMLFIHGDSDDYVPTEMAQQCYDAKTKGYRELWITKDTGHARSYSNHPAKYTMTVRKFLKYNVDADL